MSVSKILIDIDREIIVFLKEFEPLSSLFFRRMSVTVRNSSETVEKMPPGINQEITNL